MVAVLTFIAFYLENLFASFFNTGALWNLYVICTLVLVYPFFHNDNKKYLIYCLLVGFFYDVIFTNTLFLHSIIFYILGWSIIKINFYVVNSVYTTVYIALAIIFLYLLITYLLYGLTGQLVMSIEHFLIQYYNVILLNIIYNGIIFVIIEKISKKYHILKMN